MCQQSLIGNAVGALSAISSPKIHSPSIGKGVGQCVSDLNVPMISVFQVTIACLTVPSHNDSQPIVEWSQDMPLLSWTDHESDHMVTTHGKSDIREKHASIPNSFNNRKEDGRR
ncbi:MAG: hypothetical protein C4K48_07040 [Candidatus Thorarchaeota archaeon]|nr:MAG: hypothetical protein C4K48_07040 [Candidatus Thorarchaeota archaeon]